MALTYPERTSKKDMHKLDQIFHRVGSRWVMIPLWFLSVAVGVIISVHYSDWVWLSKFSAIGIMLGTLLTLSPLFRQGIYLSTADAGSWAGLDDEGNVSATSPASRIVANNIVIGCLMIIFSSILNGFADLIPPVVLLWFTI